MVISSAVRPSLGDAAGGRGGDGRVTQRRDLKKLVRARMRKTGEPYTTARAHLVGPRPPALTPPSAPAGGVMYSHGQFTEHGKKVLTLAQEEAVRQQHGYIGTEHILVGLMLESDGLAAKALDNLGVELDTVRRTIEAVLGRHERPVLPQIIPTSRVKTAIELAFEEARQMGHPYVGTEHLLLGILVEGEGVAAHVLEDLGANLPTVRAEIARLLNEQGVPTVAGLRPFWPGRAARTSEPEALAMLALLLRRFGASLQAPDELLALLDRIEQEWPDAPRRSANFERLQPLLDAWREELGR
jgi:ClpA/ClpB-like protein